MTIAARPRPPDEEPLGATRRPRPSVCWPSWASTSIPIGYGGSIRHIPVGIGFDVRSRHRACEGVRPADRDLGWRAGSRDYSSPLNRDELRADQLPHSPPKGVWRHPIPVCGMRRGKVKPRGLSERERSRTAFPGRFSRRSKPSCQ